MVDLIVQRHGGTHPGDDIIDPLIATDSIAIIRGRNELDARAKGKQQVEYETLPRSGLQPGQVVEVHDALQGSSYRGKIVALALSKSLPGGRIRLTIEKVSTFQ